LDLVVKSDRLWRMAIARATVSSTRLAKPWMGCLSIVVRAVAVDALEDEGFEVTATTSAWSVLLPRERHEQGGDDEVPRPGSLAAPFPPAGTGCGHGDPGCGREKGPRSSNGAGPSPQRLVKETCASAGCLRRRSTAHLHQRSSAGPALGAMFRQERGLLTLVIVEHLGVARWRSGCGRGARRAGGCRP
jgi:hypothetical protein